MPSTGTVTNNWQVQHSRAAAVLAACARACLFALICSQMVYAQRWPDEHHDPPFYYHADFSLQPYHQMLQGVTQLQHEIPKTLGLSPLEERVHLFLFEQQNTYESYLKKYFPNVPKRPALFIKQRGPGMVFARLGPEFTVDLRHETTHSVLHGVLPMVPLWLDEGLAEYFEMPAKKRVVGHPHFAQVKRLAERGKAPPIESLERLGDLSHMQAGHYRDAWAWVHFMLHGPPEAKKVLVDFLRDIESSIPPGQLSSRLRSQVAHVDVAFINHFRQIRVPSTASGFWRRKNR